MQKYSFRGAVALLVPVLLFCLVTPSRARAQDCEHRADRTATAQLSGVDQVVVIAGPGELEVTGRSGVTGLSARGRACALDADRLDDLVLEVRREGSTLVLEARHPEHMDWRNNRYAYTDVVVDLPLGTPVEIHDGSGELTFAGTGATRVEDGSGNLTGSDIRGALSIEDGSGNIELRTVAGSVEIEDGSGEVDVAGVRGSVEIEDGSGEIRVRQAESVLVSDGSGEIRVADITGNVLVDDDGSGSISVEGIGGNFTVDDDGSGDVSYTNVSGRVDIPDEDD